MLKCNKFHQLIFFVDVYSNSGELQQQGKETAGEQTVKTEEQEPSPAEARKKCSLQTFFSGPFLLPVSYCYSYFIFMYYK